MTTQDYRKEQAMDCPICHKEIGGVGTEVEMIESKDQLSAWMLHPECYEQYEARSLAIQQARLLARQQKAQNKIAAWNALSAK
jgi:hypothetical protein